MTIESNNAGSNNLNQVLRGYSQPPPDFALLAELWPLSQRPESGIEDLAVLIQQSEGLSQALIRVGNSPPYGGWKPVQTLAEALRRLGFSDTLKVAALHTQRSLINESLIVYDLTPEQFVSQTLGVALLMEFLAHEAEINPSTAYVCGLLHGIGYFPVARLLTKIKPKARAPADQDILRLARWEREETGFDHAKLGGLMLDSWGFPKDITDVIANQFHPGLAASLKRPAALLFISRRVLPCVLYPQHFQLSQIDLPLNVLNLANIRRLEIETCLPSVIAWLRSSTALAESVILCA